MPCSTSAARSTSRARTSCASADGALFSAADPAASSLSVAAPVAFGFLGRDPAPVAVRASGLLVPPGEALSLVGGDVSVSGGLTGILFAPAGRVTLAALASPGALRLEDGASSAAHGGRVTLDDFATLLVSGDGSGVVVVRAGELVMTGEALILADNDGPTDAAGGIDIEVGEARIEQGGAIVAGVGELGTGAGPEILIRAGSIRLAEGGFLSSRSLGAGAPGAITLEAETVHLAGSAVRRPTGISTDPLNPTLPANAGPVTIRAERSLVIENGSLISTQTALSDGGPITLEAPLVVIADATVTSSVTGTAASAGEAGRIVIASEALLIRDGAIVASDASGLGEGGQVVLELGAGGLTLEDAFVTASTSGVGRGGRVAVETPGTIEIRGGAILSVAAGTGDAGDIELEAERLVLDESVIASQSLASGGGRITLTVADRIELTRSELSTSVLGGAGTTAGDITIDPDFLILDASAIIAQANQGQGGNIQITVEHADPVARQPDQRERGPGRHRRHGRGQHARDRPVARPAGGRGRAARRQRAAARALRRAPRRRRQQLHRDRPRRPAGRTRPAAGQRVSGCGRARDRRRPDGGARAGDAMPGRAGLTRRATGAAARRAAALADWELDRRPLICFSS